MNYSTIAVIFNNSLPVGQHVTLQNETKNMSDLEDKEYYLYYYPLEDQENNVTFYRDSLTDFSESYRQVHYYLCLVICIFGLITNIFIIIVFTRKNMISPINAILTGLAVADMMLLLCEIPLYIRHITTDNIENIFLPHGWVVFELFLENCELASHTISTWLTITVAIWRLIGISFPIASKNWLDMTRAKIAIICTYVMSTLFFIPYFVSYTVREYEENGELKYKSVASDILESNPLIQDYSFWFLSVVIQLVPCFALTILTLSLICVLCKANHQRKKLTNNSEIKTHDRTTMMLIAVLMIFLVTKLPLGFIVLLGLIIGPSFFNTSLHFLDICVLLGNINSSINFIVFCSMSQKFRDKFTQIFLLHCKKKNKRETTKSTKIST